MLNLKTSISALAVAASLTIGFAPQASFAQNQNNGAAGGAQAMKEYIEKRDAKMAAIDKEFQKTPTTATSPAPPAPVVPAGPSVAETCWGAFCSAVKWAIPQIEVATAIVDAVVGEPDEAKAQKEHEEIVHKAALDQEKAEEAKKSLEQQKSAVAPSTTEKTVDLKNVETKKNAPIEIPARRSTTKLVSLDVPKAKTLTVPRVTATTVAHLEVSHPTVSASRVAVNVPRSTINIPHPTINIPVIVRR